MIDAYLGGVAVDTVAGEKPYDDDADSNGTLLEVEDLVALRARGRHPHRRRAEGAEGEIVTVIGPNGAGKST